jgi:hypothetical protein
VDAAVSCRGAGTREAAFARQATQSGNLFANNRPRSRDRLPAMTDSHSYRVVRLESPPRAAASPLEVVPGAAPTTLINIFDTDQARLTQLVKTWITVGEPFTHHPGFLQAALHQSTDGTRVVNFAYWRSPSDWQDLVAHHGPDFARFRSLGQSDPHLYEIVHVLESASTATGR